MQDIHGHAGPARAGSDRNFGAVFVAFFVVVGFWPLLSGGSPRLWALLAALAFLVPTLIAPWVLHPLNILWFKFGMLLHAVVSPVVMGLIFLLTIVPMALLMRLFGKDTLDIGPHSRGQRESFWISRDQRTIDAESMRNQF